MYVVGPMPRLPLLDETRRGALRQDPHGEEGARSRGIPSLLRVKGMRFDRSSPYLRNVFSRRFNDVVNHHHLGGVGSEVQLVKVEEVAKRIVSFHVCRK